MKAVQFDNPGGPETLYLGPFPDPKPQAHEVLVSVKATALNRADTLQRQGKYPPPKGASPIMGLELAGEVVSVGAKVKGWKQGDKVMALLPGGGYAELAAVPQDMLMPIPSGFSFEEAAAIPEVFLTAFQAIHWIAVLQQGESILIHAGASGVGTAAIQLARQIGAEIFVTASAPKHALCLELGAALAIDYKVEDFSEVIQSRCSGKGVDVVIDFLAASYFQQNLNSLAVDGRMVCLALMGGVHLESANIAPILVKRLRIQGSTLRARSLAYKVQLSQAFASYALPLFESGELKPVIDSIYDWQAVVEAHRCMEAHKNKGKIVLRIGG